MGGIGPTGEKSWFPPHHPYAIKQRFSRGRSEDGRDISHKSITPKTYEILRAGMLKK